jgi:phosphatidylinositol glycan class Q protein
VQTRAAKGFAVLSIFFLIILVPIERIAAREAVLVGHLIKTFVSRM